VEDLQGDVTPQGRLRSVDGGDFGRSVDGGDFRVAPRGSNNGSLRVSPLVQRVVVLKADPLSGLRSHT